MFDKLPDNYCTGPQMNFKHHHFSKLLLFISYNFCAPLQIIYMYIFLSKLKCQFIQQPIKFDIWFCRCTNLPLNTPTPVKEKTKTMNSNTFMDFLTVFLYCVGVVALPMFAVCLPDLLIDVISAAVTV